MCFILSCQVLANYICLGNSFAVRDPFESSLRSKRFGMVVKYKTRESVNKNQTFIGVSDLSVTSNSHYINNTININI